MRTRWVPLISRRLPLPTVFAVSWRDLAIALLGVVDGVLLAWGSDGGAAQQLFAVMSAGAIGCMTLLWLAFDDHFERTPLWWILGVALCVRLIAVQASPLLEDDHFRYLWDGLRTATSFDPYRLAPVAYFSDTTLPPQWQAVLSGINNPDIPTIYGPVLQLLFGFAFLIAPGKIGAIQFILLVVDLVVLGVLVHKRVNSRWLLVYAIHPLILKEAMATAHPDGLLALLLLLALIAWQRRRAMWVGTLLGCAIATKIAALVVVPLYLVSPTASYGYRNGFARWLIVVATSACLSSLALYLPFVLAGGSDSAALAIFSEQWRFNPLLYRFVEDILPPHVARMFAAVLILGVVGATAWRSHRGVHAGTLAQPPVHRALTVLLLLSPVVNPWYWMWALALGVQAGRIYVVCISACAALSYLNSTVLCEAGFCANGELFSPLFAPYAVGWSVTFAQLAVLAIAWAYEHGRSRGHA